MHFDVALCYGEQGEHNTSIISCWNRRRHHRIVCGCHVAFGTLVEIRLDNGGFLVCVMCSHFMSQKKSSCSFCAYECGINWHTIELMIFCAIVECLLNTLRMYSRLCLRWGDFQVGAQNATLC